MLVTFHLMRVYSYFFLCLGLFFGACSVSKVSKSTESEIEVSLKETQYYRLFTDATKYALAIPGLQSKKTAVGMYNACIIEFPERAAPYYQLSSLYLAEQSFELAREYGRKAEMLDTNNYWYKLHLANIYQYENNYDSAAHYYEKALRLRDDTEMKYNLAILYSKSSHPDKAIKLLNELENNNLRSREIVLMKHNVYHNMNLYDSAIVQLELLTKYFPEDPASFGILAEYLAEIGRNAYAKSIYDRLLIDQPNNGLILLSYAEFYMRRNVVDSAFIYYNDAVCCSDLNFEAKINLIVNFINSREFIRKYKNEVFGLLNVLPKDSSDFRIYAAYADVFINNEEYENAVPYLDTALVSEKTNFMLWEQTIMIYNFLEKHKDVVRTANECIIYFPEKPNIYFMKALSEFELGNYTIAVSSIDTLIEKNPEKPLLLQSYNLLAETYRQLGDYEESDKYYEKILVEESDNLLIRNNYAYYLSLREENLDRARELSYLTILREPENATYLDTYGWIMFKLGDYKEAKSYIEKAIRNGAYNNPEVLDHYGEIMYELDKCNEAIEAWAKVLELDSSYNISDKLLEAKSDCQ